jgi:uncharacterized protein YcfL
MRISKHLILLSIVLFLFGCSAGRNAREQKTQEWILNAKRPIKVIQHSTVGTFHTTRNNRFYTLIDQSGKVYLADGVRFQLPSVIE